VKTVARRLLKAELSSAAIVEIVTKRIEDIAASTNAL
jgi:hypothetical protein